MEVIGRIDPPPPLSMTTDVEEVSAVINDGLALRLLYIRDASGSDARPDVPAVEPGPSVRGVAGIRRTDVDIHWSSAWERIWKWNSAAQSIARSGMPSELPDLEPSPWFSEAGWEDSDRAAFARWARELTIPSPSSLSDPRVLAVLPEATSRGLRNIYVLPVRGPYAARPLSTLLVVSSATYQSVDLMTRALEGLPA